jgi:SAM-dependent methyltransferase
MASTSIPTHSDGEAAIPGAAADGLRAGLHGLWSAVAGGWAEYADEVDVRGRPVTDAMLAATAPRAGERVLELACGPGGTGLAAAALVAPGGEVVLSDVAAEMTAIAAARAAEAGVPNVTTRVLDLEHIDEPDGAYDVVLCREGLMFVLDPARAAGEIARVLAPRGRVAIATWGPRERNPWLGIVLDAVAEQTGHPVPPPGIPGPFSLSDPAELVTVLSGAGLADVAATEVAVPLRAATFAEWWGRTTALGGPVAKILALMPDDGARDVRARAREMVARYEIAGGLDIPGVSLLATGRRA